MAPTAPVSAPGAPLSCGPGGFRVTLGSDTSVPPACQATPILAIIALTFDAASSTSLTGNWFATAEAAYASGQDGNTVMAGGQNCF